MKIEFILKNATLITGKNGEVLENAILVVKNGKIAFVGKENDSIRRAHAGVDVYDLTGRYVLPGMIDCHLHLWGARDTDYLHRAFVPDKLALIRAVKDAQTLLLSGFTTVRDAGGNHALYVRNACEEKTISAPKILCAHKVICITGGHYDLHFLSPKTTQTLDTHYRLADGPDDCRRAVREQIREGADFIKICTTGGIMSSRGSPQHHQFTMEELHAIVDEASAFGKTVSAHAYGKTGICNAIDAGVHTIEHGTYLDEEIARRMADRQIRLIPTLSVLHTIAEAGGQHQMSPAAVKKARTLVKHAFSAVALARKMGVSIASGTDFSGCPPMRHGDNAVELSLLVKAGMTPYEALTAATSGAARAIGIEEKTGALEKEKSADLLVVDKNPLEDISILTQKQTITMIIKEGAIVMDRRTPQG